MWNYNRIAKSLLFAMTSHPARLTGGEIRFIRHYFKLTLKQFATRFGVTHPGVIKWEKSGAAPAAMAWGTEKDIRLFVLDKLGVSAKKITETYRSLEKQAKAKPHPIKMDLAA